MASGSCVCGAVQYSVDGPYYSFQYCYCSRCRKATGSAHASSLFVRPEHFAWTTGEDHVRRFELPTAKYWCNGWCDLCGSELPWLSRTGKSWIVPAGTLDEDPGERPQKRIFFGSRAVWHTEPEGLETFEDFR